MKHRSLLLKLLSAAIVFGAWEIAGRIPVSYAFPTFTESMAALARMTFDGSIFVAYAETLRPLLVGVVISAIAGIGLGLWIGLSSRFDWLFSPIFIVMQAAPLAALIPILVMVYGIGLTSKVFVVCIMAMPVIVLNTAGAVRNTPASIKDMAKSFLAKDHDVLLKIILPAASPVIFSASGSASPPASSAPSFRNSRSRRRGLATSSPTAAPSPTMRACMRPSSPSSCWRFFS